MQTAKRQISCLHTLMWLLKVKLECESKRLSEIEIFDVILFMRVHLFFKTDKIVGHLQINSTKHKQHFFSFFKFCLEFVIPWKMQLPISPIPKAGTINFFTKRYIHLLLPYVDFSVINSLPAEIHLFPLIADCIAFLNHWRYFSKSKAAYTTPVRGSEDMPYKCSVTLRYLSRYER